MRISWVAVHRVLGNHLNAATLCGHEAGYSPRKTAQNRCFLKKNVCPKARQCGETMDQSAATDCSSHLQFQGWRFPGEDRGCVLARAVGKLSLATLSTSSRPARAHGRAQGRLF